MVLMRRYLYMIAITILFVGVQASGLTDIDGYEPENCRLVIECDAVAVHPPDPDPVPDPDPDPVPEPNPDPIPEPDPDPEPPPVPPTQGMWTEVIASDAFRAVLPTDTELAAWSAGGVPLRGVVGPKSVLTKWNSVSFDPNQGCVYAMGGGHEDYGGNEVYQACVGGTWVRLNNPSPYTGELINTAQDGTEYRLPLEGPPAVHTYAGVTYHPGLHGLVFGAYSSFYSRHWQKYPYPVVPYWYIFDIADRKWIQTPVNESTASLGFTVYVPTTGNVYSLGRNQVQTVIDQNLDAKTLRYQPKAAQHVAVYDAHRNMVWSTDSWKGGLVKWAVTPDRLTRTGSVAIPLDAKEAIGHHAAIAERDGMLWFFGGKQLVTYEPDADEWTIIPKPEVSPSNNKAFRKFFYWPREDKFVSVSDSGSVWLLDPALVTGDPVGETPRANVDGTDYATLTDAAAALKDGSTMTIYPGTYSEGFIVAPDDVTIQAAGATIDATLNGKAPVIQKGSRLTVIGLAATGLHVSSGNASLVRVEPGADSLTLRAVQISDSDGGFALTGNGPTGTVLVENSLGERNGNGGQAHGIYTGAGIGTTVCNGSRVLGGKGAGHLWKSRSQANLLLGCTLDGLDTHHSRVVDIPCGGTLHIKDTKLVQSPAADNRDLIAIGVEACREAANRPQPWESRVIFENATVIATKPNPRLFTTKEPLTVECRGTNMFVGVASPC